MRISIARDTDTGEYRLQREGSNRPAEIVPVIEPMNITEACKALLGYAKEQQTLREAACTTLAEIVKFGADRIALWKGNVDKRGGLPSELNAAFRDCEADFFKQFLSKDHPAHKAFLGSLPKLNDKGQTFEVGGKMNQEAQFQYFLTVTRKAPSYANAKNMILGLFGYCGQTPYTDDGFLIPPEVMRAMVANARDGAGGTRDNSFKAQLYDIFNEMVTKEGYKKEPTANWPEIVRTVNELQGWCKQYGDIAARQAANMPKAPDAATQAQTALREAGGPSGQGTAVHKEKAEA